ncbi:flagellar filament capping protein FliD [Paenibacillus sp.]|uniref:flagellar filament capping protein FliD n=1 Tax=Paenibacillus sp. TaxID=58172 RepID=UPI0028A77748|nr:flagellar filament capping protein FliD [Paenibacillus sp.]
MVTRINGFSGMDIDSMVKSMMAAKKAPLDKLNQQKTILNWTRDSYREINSKLYDFRSNKLIDKYGRNEALNTNQSVVSGNTNAVKATALATANGVDMDVSVTQLATKTTVKTSGAGSNFTTSTTLSQLQTKLGGTVLTEGYKLTVNGEVFSFSGDTAISSVIANINSSTANVTATFDEVTGQFSLAAKSSGPPTEATITAAAKGKVVLGADTSLLNLFSSKSDSTTLAQLQNSLYGTSITDANTQDFTLKFGTNNLSFKGNQSLSDVVSYINTNTATLGGATASLVSGQLVVTSGGVEQTISGTAANLVKGTATTEGVVAKYTINGTSLENDSNSFAVNGVQLTLLATTNINGTDTPAKVSKQVDTDKAVATVKGFIDDYNALITSLNAKIDEAKYRTFTPLTDDQKKDMKESDITAWTEKAKSGLLKNDDVIKTILSSMRMDITEKLGDLSDIGITTGSYFEKGKLYLDESKLRTALNNNSQGVMDLLQGPQSSPDTGLFDKLSARVSDALNSISERAGTNKYSGDLTSSYKEESVMGKKLKDYNTRISDMLTMLNNAETRYYKQFSAMETAMNKLQAQSSSLFSTSS